MNKFEDVDVIASLEAIMKQNTAFYQNDFDLDRNILQKAAASPTAEDRRLLWFSRPSGTSCFRERDVFLKGTRQHNTWRFYGEQTRDKVLAYAVKLTGIVNGKIKGNLYELDYPQHFRHVKCTVCGTFFASTSNSVKYCPDCRKRITRRQAAERMRKKRTLVTQ